MKPLNIPLTGSRQTARRRRRAVWRWGLLLGVFLLLWSMTHLKATQNPFLEYTPENTRFIIHLHPTQNQWENILGHLGKEVLTPTGLTLQELAPHIQGSVALFLTTSDEAIVGLESSLSEQQLAVLANHDIHTQEVADDLYLLAGELQKTHITPTRIGKAQRLLPYFAGSIMDIEAGAPHTIIRATRNRLYLDPPSLSSGNEQLFVNPNTIFAGSFSQTTQLPLPSFIEDVFAHVSGGSRFTDTLTTEGDGGNFSLFNDSSYLLTLHKDLPLATIQKILAFQERLAQPVAVNRRLLDGTQVEELRIDDTSPTPEIIDDPNWTIMRLETPEITFFAGKHKNLDRVFFTNSADILIETTQVSQENQGTTACEKPENLFVNLPELVSFLQNQQHHFSTPIPLSNSSFVHIGIDKSVFGDKIVACEDNFEEKSS